MSVAQKLTRAVTKHCVLSASSVGGMSCRHDPLTLGKQAQLGTEAKKAERGRPAYVIKRSAGNVFSSASWHAAWRHRARGIVNSRRASWRLPAHRQPRLVFLQARLALICAARNIVTLHRRPSDGVLRPPLCSILPTSATRHARGVAQRESVGIMASSAVCRHADVCGVAVCLCALAHLDGAKICRSPSHRRAGEHDD